MIASADIIIPVYNSPQMLRLCLASVGAHTDTSLARVIIVLDGCDAHTTRLARQWCDERPWANIIERERNGGFIQACNTGFRASEADLAILLNSDTCVTPNWVNKIIACFNSDPTIGVASTISNFCPHNAIPILPGKGYLDMNRLIERLSERRYPDITTPEGFCFAVSRTCLDRIGYLDPVFGKGYGEESDLSMRARYFGFRTVCVDDTYIFHHGRGTFGEEQRTFLYERNRVIFHSRWGDKYKREFHAFKAENPLATLRARVAAGANETLEGLTWI